MVITNAKCLIVVILEIVLELSTDYNLCLLTFSEPTSECLPNCMSKYNYTEKCNTFSHNVSAPNTCFSSTNSAVNKNVFTEALKIKMANETSIVTLIPEIHIDWNIGDQFDRVAAKSHLKHDFKRQVLALNAELCGTNCIFADINMRYPVAKNCAPCFCDHLCLIYSDCCPDFQLLGHFNNLFVNYSRSSLDIKSESKLVITCEKSHLKVIDNEDDFNNFFSMINYCPSSLTNNTIQRNVPKTQKDEKQLENMCTNTNNSLHWDFMRPLSSKKGIVYRNRFCAFCHNEKRENLIFWRTEITCSSKLLQNVISSEGMIQPRLTIISIAVYSLYYFYEQICLSYKLKNILTVPKKYARCMSCSCAV